MILYSLLLTSFINLACLIISLKLPAFSSLPWIIVFNASASLVLFFLLKKQPTQSFSTQGQPVLITEEEEFLLLDSLPDFLCLKDKDGHWLKASQQYLDFFDLEQVDYAGKTDLELVNFVKHKEHELKLSAIQDKSVWHVGLPVKETKTLDLTNSSNLMEITRTPIFNAVREKSRLLISGHVLDDSYKDQSEQITYMLKVCHLNIVFLDAQFKINQVNNSFSLMTGYHLEELIEKPLSGLLEGDFELARRDFFKLENQGCYSGEFVCRHKNGQYFPVKVEITEIPKQNGKDFIYFATLQDITRQKQSEKRIMQIAHYDELTGLANRAMFFDRLGVLLSESKRRHLHAVVFCINLDRFKSVNDSLGHDAGNQVLKEAASRLRSVMGNRDVVARLNGDEFAVLILNEKSYEQTTYSASLIAGEVLKRLSDKFYVNKRELFIGASIGISIFPEDGETTEILLKHADVAMYEAKQQGRNNYQFFKKDFAIAEQDRLLMEFNLRKAIEKNELQLYYQPQYYAVGGKIFGAEVLIRWAHGITGERNLIPPDYFIAIAEESGIIIDIGAWVMRKACFQLKQWLEQGYALQQISVNVSARQFSDDEFLNKVETALREANLEPSRLELEITESLLIGDIKKIELQLSRLKKMGVKIALDDFGTGYSSLSYLKNFPIDILKIDQSFISNMTVDSKDAKIAAAIIEMGHSLGQKIIAEGVETEQQLIYLTRRNCDIIQGYYFSPPLPSYKMTDLLRLQAQNGLDKKKNTVSNHNNSPFINHS